MAEIAELIFQADTAQLEKAEKQLNKINKTGAQTEKVTKATSNSMGRLSHSVGNAAFQFQDLAVQIQGGVAPSRALAQQVPQLLGGFGAIGAVTGLIAGLGFALAGPLVDGLFASINSAEGLEEALSSLSDTIKITNDGTVLLTDEFARLATKSRDVAEVQLKARLIDAALASKSALGLLKQETSDLTAVLDRNGGMARGNANRYERLAESYGLTVGELKQLREAANAALENPENLDEFQRLTNELALNGESASEKFIKLAQAVNQASTEIQTSKEITDQLNGALSDLDTFLENSTESAVRRAEQQREIQRREEEQRKTSLARQLESLEFSLMSEEEKIRESGLRRLEIINESASLLNLSETRVNELRKANTEKVEAEITAIQDREKKARAAQLQSSLNGFSQLFGDLTGLMSSESKKAFEVGKAAATANAIIKGIESTLNAYAFGSSIGGPPVGVAFAGLAAAATGGMIAQIQSARPPGRAQGGQVRPGEAYRVGEFGPETLVMGSRGGVIAPTSSGGGGIQVLNNIKVIGGNGDAKVSSNGRQINDKQFVVDIVVDLMANQSSPARTALHSTSNVTPRGRR